MYYHVYFKDHYHTAERFSYDIQDIEHIKNNIIIPYLKKEEFYFDGEPVQGSWFTKIIVKSTTNDIEHFIFMNRSSIDGITTDEQKRFVVKEHLSKAPALTDKLINECKAIIQASETKKDDTPKIERPIPSSTKIIIPETEQEKVSELLPRPPKKFYQSGKFWTITGVLITIAGILISLFTTQSKPIATDHSITNIGDNNTNVIDQSTTYINSSNLVVGKVDPDNIYKEIKRVNLNMSIRYILQNLGVPPVQYQTDIVVKEDTLRIEYLIYQTKEFVLKIGTLEGEKIANMAVLGVDTTYKVNLNMTPITIGETTFGDMRYDGLLERSIGNKYAGIETVGGIYMANPGNYWYANVGVYCGVGPETEKFSDYIIWGIEEEVDLMTPAKYYNDVRINWASIAREPEYLSHFWYEDFTDIYI